MEFEIDRTVYLIKEIKSKTIKDFVNSVEVMREVSCSSSRPINIIINCEGGQVDEAFFLYDYLKSLNHSNIRTVVTGKCWSAANLVFCGGNERYCYKHSCFMLHNITLTLEPARPAALKALSNYVEDQQLEFLKIVAQHTSVRTFHDNLMHRIQEDEQYFFDGDFAYKLGYAKLLA